MPATKISDYAVGQNKWDELLTTIEKQRKGFIALSLTNYDNNSEPAIAAGSYVEISGALYGFTSEEAINGTPSSGDTNYIYIDTTDLKPYWTTTAPTWSADKNGWYDSTETDRYIGGCYYDGTNYTGKWVYQLLGQVRLDDIPDGSTYKKVAGVNASNLITASSILDNAVGLDALDTSGWEYGTFDLGGEGATVTIPKGLYYVFDPDYVELHVYYGDGSTYKNLGAPSDPMFLLSDGSYVKLYSVGASSAHLAYIKITA